MPLLKVRNLPDPLYRALRTRALAHGRSIDAEVRVILERTIGAGETGLKPKRKVDLDPGAGPGTLMSSYAKAAGLTNEDFDVFDNIREKIFAQQVDDYLSSLTPTSLRR